MMLTPPMTLCHTTQRVWLAQFFLAIQVLCRQYIHRWRSLPPLSASRVSNSPTGWWDERQDIFFLPSRKRPWEPRPLQYTDSHIRLGSHSVRPCILCKSTLQWLRTMQRTSLPWWGWNSKDGTRMASWIWTRHPFHIPIKNLLAYCTLWGQAF
jgi:hypothetical protein